MSEPTKGDKVSWNTPQGKTSGHITRKITHDDKIQGHTVKASPQEPQYEVASDKTGKKAAHKPDSLSS